MEHKYKYIGEVEVFVVGVGLVKPNEDVVSVEPINHPLFIEQKEIKKNK